MEMYMQIKKTVTDVIDIYVVHITFLFNLMFVKIACTRHVFVNIAPNDKENPIAKNQERIYNTNA